MKTVIDICDIRHNFGKKVVLDKVNFKIEKGEIFGLLGPSGAGKTTLIKILTGQLHPAEGKALLLGKASVKLKGNDYKKIGIMMDNFGLYERLNCYDNLKFYTMINGIGTERIDEVLDKVGLKDARKTSVSNLSKGMRSRLLLARGILNRPEILFLDEPTSGLDPMTTAEIHKLILEEKEKGTTIFLTTHNMAEAEKLCDNVALLNEGKIVEYGNPKETCRKYNHQKKFLIHLYDGSEIALPHDKTSMEKLTGYLEKGELETIHSTEPNLETVFNRKEVRLNDETYLGDFMEADERYIKKQNYTDTVYYVSGINTYYGECGENGWYAGTFLLYTFCGNVCGNGSAYCNGCYHFGRKREKHAESIANGKCKTGGISDWNRHLHLDNLHDWCIYYKHCR